MRDIKWTGALAVYIRPQYIGALFEWKIVGVEDTSLIILHCTTQDRRTHKELCKNHSKIYGIEDDRCLSHPLHCYTKRNVYHPSLLDIFPPLKHQPLEERDCQSNLIPLSYLGFMFKMGGQSYDPCIHLFPTKHIAKLGYFYFRDPMCNALPFPHFVWWKRKQW